MNFRGWQIPELRLIIQDMIKGFNIAADAVLHGTYILQDIVGCDIFRINDASDIKVINDIIKGKAVYLGNQFGIGNCFGKE